MSKRFVAKGRLSNGRRVDLDETVPLEDSTVMVTIEPLPAPPNRPYEEVMAEIRARQAKRGHRAPTREEVDRFLEGERDAWRG